MAFGILLVLASLVCGIVFVVKAIKNKSKAMLKRALISFAFILGWPIIFSILGLIPGGKDAAANASKTTDAPTVEPTATPTVELTATPTAKPTDTPEPTATPTPEPPAKLTLSESVWDKAFTAAAKSLKNVSGIEDAICTKTNDGSGFITIVVSNQFLIVDTSDMINTGYGDLCVVISGYLNNAVSTVDSSIPEVTPGENGKLWDIYDSWIVLTNGKASIYFYKAVGQSDYIKVNFTKE